MSVAELRVFSTELIASPSLVIYYCLQFLFNWSVFTDIFPCSTGTVVDADKVNPIVCFCRLVSNLWCCKTCAQLVSDHRQNTNTWVFADWIPFVLPNQQWQSSGWKESDALNVIYLTLYCGIKYRWCMKNWEFCHVTNFCTYIRRTGIYSPHWWWCSVNWSKALTPWTGHSQPSQPPIRGTLAH